MGLRDDILAFRPYNEQEETEKRLMLQYMDTFPDLLTRENEMAHFTASCWIVNPARTHALMAFHNLYQSWAWLGGHADGEEDLLRVALREANEESGIVGARPLINEIFSLEILGVDGHVKRGRYVATHLHLNCTYLLEADDRLPHPCQGRREQRRPLDSVRRRRGRGARAGDARRLSEAHGQGRMLNRCGIRDHARSILF